MLSSLEGCLLWSQGEVLQGWLTVSIRIIWRMSSSWYGCAKWSGVFTSQNGVMSLFMMGKLSELLFLRPNPGIYFMKRTLLLTLLFLIFRQHVAILDVIVIMFCGWMTHFVVTALSMSIFTGWRTI